MLNAVHIPLNIKTIKKSNRGKYTLNFPPKVPKIAFFRRYQHPRHGISDYFSNRTFPLRKEENRQNRVERIKSPVFNLRNQPLVLSLYLKENEGENICQHTK